MDDRDYAVKEIKKELSHITENNRNKIQLITLMADDYSNFAEDVVMAICDFIRELPPNKKLIGIYVMDSILKYQSEPSNSTEKYRQLFGREIVDLFVDTFKKAPIEHRHSLHKVRVTWQPILPKSTLYRLDLKIQDIDKVWPVMKDGGVAKAMPAATAAKPKPAPVAADHRKENKPVRSEPPTSSHTVAPSPVPRPVPVPSSSKVTPPKMTIRKPVPESSTASIIPPKKTPSNSSVNTAVKSSSASSVASSESNKSNGPAPVVSVKVNGSIKDPRLARRQAAQGVPQPPTSVKSESTRVPVAKPSVPVAPKSNLHSSPVLSSSAESVAPLRTLKTETPDSVEESMDTSEGSRKTHRAGRKKRPKHADSVERDPTRVIIRPPVDEKKRRRVDEPHHVQPTAAPGAHAFLPPPVNVNLPLPNVSMPPPIVTPPLMSPPIKMEVDETWRSGPPPPVTNGMQPPVMSHTITNETPKINVSSNNRIFVEGRAYEVFYIKDVAVIEQNGLPHKISFTGPPRDVLVDGHPIRLSFEEDRHIYLDGCLHPIRFGAPSRELYIGHHPFRGGFGGPPMIANINGVKHEFRLLGSPPEVRIDKDPCYELARYMNNIRGAPAPAPPKEEKLNVRELLEKIKESGLINSIKSSIKKTANAAPAAGPPPEAKPSPSARIDTVGSSRENLAPSNIKDFNINVLSVRYSQVVDALHAPRTACHHCGISFPDQSSQSFQRHIDMHVQDLLRTKEAGKSRSRQWYMSIDTWLAFDELTEVQKDPAQEAAKASDDNADADAANGGASPSDAIATSSLNKNCTVCHERFVEYYDNDEDEWRFQDGVVSNGLAVHRYCLEQMGGTVLAAVKKEDPDEAVPDMYTRHGDT
uniref:CID domain-containing protein n=1 Tax=Panagrellus redivivus TaxID=6233 RepID=A0A7E4UZI3_PANRE